MLQESEPDSPTVPSETAGEEVWCGVDQYLV